MTTLRVCFVGIGNMGWPMAANLVRTGHAVSVVDLDEQRCRAFVAEHGGTTGDPVFQAATADVIVTILPTSNHVRAAIDALTPGLRPGVTVLEMSSGVPALTRAMAEGLKPRGVAVVDCAVSGGVARAKDGTLAMMVGGAEADIARIEPLLGAFGTTVHRCGELGAGQAMKALNNLSSAAGLLITVEALLIGQRAGLDPSTMVDVLNASTGMNNSTQRKLKQFVLSRRFESGFGLDLMVKDLGIALSLMDEHAADVPFAAECLRVWSDAAVALGPSLDHTEIARASEERVGFELDPTGGP